MEKKVERIGDYEDKDGRKRLILDEEIKINVPREAPTPKSVAQFGSYL